MAMRASVVQQSPPFVADLTTLRVAYPAIDDAIDEVTEPLRLGYQLPLDRVPGTAKGIYALRVDYPPLGGAGRGVLVMTFHMTEPHPSAVSPYQTFTLLTLSERKPK
jgi:hypothetical protein